MRRGGKRWEETHVFAMLRRKARNSTLLQHCHVFAMLRRKARNSTLLQHCHVFAMLRRKARNSTLLQHCHVFAMLRRKARNSTLLQHCHVFAMLRRKARNSTLLQHCHVFAMLRRKARNSTLLRYCHCPCGQHLLTSYCAALEFLLFVIILTKVASICWPATAGEYWHVCKTEMCRRILACVQDWDVQENWCCKLRRWLSGIRCPFKLLTERTYPRDNCTQRILFIYP